MSFCGGITKETKANIKNRAKQLGLPTEVEGVVMAA